MLTLQCEGHGAIGHGILGHGTVGHGIVGHGTVKQSTLGYGTVGHGTVRYNTELKLKVQNVVAEINCSVFNTANDKIQRIHTDKFAWNNHMH